MVSNGDKLFEQQFARVKEATNVNTDAELSRVLGITQVSVYCAKKNKRVKR